MWLPAHPPFFEKPRGRYASKLPRRRNSPISCAIKAAVYEERRALRRQETVQQLRLREIDQNQQASQAAVNAAIQEAERILQAILAERASEEAAKQQKEESAAEPEEEFNASTSQDQNQDLHPVS